MKKRKLRRTRVMGVLNVTPDSFSDGGKYFNKRSAIARAIEMASGGADIIDVGGESTRPGAGEVKMEEELSRVIPVIEAISERVDTPISIDTRKASVAAEALKAGAEIVNDVSGLRYDPMMAEVVSRFGARVIVMHMKGTPENMQRSPRYGDLITEIKTGLKESLRIAVSAGIDKDKVIVDPGIGFGKTVRHNLEILNRLDEFKGLGGGICIGTSRKSFIGKILNTPGPDGRLAGTIATCVLAIIRGADIIRVHDVREAVEAATMADIILNSGA